jgi:hypothetical protein
LEEWIQFLFQCGTEKGEVVYLAVVADCRLCKGFYCNDWRYYTYCDNFCVFYEEIEEKNGKKENEKKKEKFGCIFFGYLCGFYTGF